MSDLGVRQLAAIVFTDVVGFSAQMGEREEETLKLVQRDAEKIKQLAVAHNGQVLKSTGDGQLMYFGSATDAVRCALELQKMVAGHSEALQYRIGIHLGDVFMKSGDVMGDGVNIAARLQAEAQPGGICLSQTVYDVVKNRIEVEATFIGERELKNIRDAVPVYQILIDAHLKKPAAPGNAVNRKPVKKSKTLLMSLAAIVGVLAITLLAVWLWNGSRGATLPLPAAQPATAPAAPVTTAPDSDHEAGMESSRHEGRKNRNDHEDKILAFVRKRLKNYSREKPLPLLAPPLPGELGKKAAETSVWLQDDRLFTKRPDGIHEVPLIDAEAKLMLRIAITLADASDPGDPDAKELRESAQEFRPRLRPLRDR
jgi:class 3 adenylate cyclase